MSLFACGGQRTTCESSLFPRCGSQELNSRNQLQQQVPFPMEPLKTGLVVGLLLTFLLLAIESLALHKLGMCSTFFCHSQDSID